jgi:hypothetical protein
VSDSINRFWYQDADGNFISKMGTFDVSAMSDRLRAKRSLLETMHRVAEEYGVEVWGGLAWDDETTHEQIMENQDDPCADPDLKDIERDLPDDLDDSPDDCIEYNDAGEPRGYM